MLGDEGTKIDVTFLFPFPFDLRRWLVKCIDSSLTVYYVMIFQQEI